MGKECTSNVLHARPRASTGTYAPAKTLVSKGVVNTAAKVVQIVMRMESGTSPRAM